MADTDFLSLIKQGADAWNQWRVANPDCTPDLNNAYLFEAVLDHFDFSGINLERTCLIGASLQRANLQGTNLQNAYANDADFTGANLAQARLNHGTFTGANFTQADLHQAEAIGTNFANACFKHARTLDWAVDETTILEDEKGEGQAIATARQAEIERLMIANLTGNAEPQFAATGSLAGQRASALGNSLARSVSAVSERVTNTCSQLLQPDDANHITAGALNEAGYAEKIEAMRAGAIAKIKQPFKKSFKGRFNFRSNSSNNGNAKGQAKGRKIQSVLNPLNIFQGAEALTRKHPWPVGLGAIALGATVMLALPRTRTEHASVVASPVSNVTNAHFTETEANNFQIAVLPCQEPPIANISEASITYEYDSGAKFYGTFVDGQPDNARGTMVYPSGNRYDGEYQDGKRSGCGTFSFVDGRRYIGEMRNDRLEGKGTWIMTNGERYIGEFKNNQCNGTGTFIFVNGATKAGRWENNQLVDSELLCDRGTLDLPASSDL